jgi:hypothetical protein
LTIAIVLSVVVGVGDAGGGLVRALAGAGLGVGGALA